jgi:hypothetical protein
MKHAKGTFKHNDWDEKPYHEVDGQKLTKTDVNVVFDGDLEAAGKSVALMNCPDDKTCHYSGYVMIDGTLDGRKGGFALFEHGVWANGMATSSWTIVDGSGRGELQGISGKGTYSAGHDETVHYAIDYELPG